MTWRDRTYRFVMPAVLVALVAPRALAADPESFTDPFIPAYVTVIMLLQETDPRCTAATPDAP